VFCAKNTVSPQRTSYAQGSPKWTNWDSADISANHESYQRVWVSRLHKQQSFISARQSGKIMKFLVYMQTDNNNNSGKRWVNECIMRIGLMKA